MRLHDKFRAAKRRLKRAVAKKQGPRVPAGDSGPSASAATAKVAVVIPVYNTMPYLADLLDSLAAQDLDPALFEIIAVDDGSTDMSGEVLDAYAAAHSNVRVIHQKNSGWPGKPRNVGIAASQAPYIFFCDADDLLGSEALRRMVDYALANDVDLLVPRMVGLGGRGVQAALFRETHLDVDLRKILGTLSPQKMFRRSMLDQHGIRFPEGMVRLEDGQMLARCYLVSERTSLLADYDYYYLRTRDDGANISSQRTSPESYTRSVSEIARILTEGDSDAERASLLVLDLYRRKCLRFYAPDRFRKINRRQARRWMSEHAKFAQRYISPALEEQLSFPHRQRAALVRAGDLNGLRRLAAAEPFVQAKARAVSVSGESGRMSMEVVLEPAGELDRLELVVRGRGSNNCSTQRFDPLLGEPGKYTAILDGASLAGFGPVIVDFYARATKDGFTGSEHRVAVDKSLPLTSPTGDFRSYATVNGKLSVDMRTKQPS